MDSLTFRAGRALIVSDSPASPWRVVFEDEGAAGYFYACDRSRQPDEDSILDSMLIYNTSALADAERERLASLQWSRDGLKAVLYIDGSAQAMADFAARESSCRSNFPNFLEGRDDDWRKSSHAWNEDAIRSFEAALYNPA